VNGGRSATDRGVIDGLLNLRCDLGHFHFSPTPSAFAGGHCEAGQKVGNCRATLRLHPILELPRNSGEVAAVNGPTTLEAKGDAPE
jgi:hypothetical protein